MIAEIEEATENLVIDRSGWVKVKFGEVAIQQKENVDRENTDLTRYVAGEHMGSEDLHLRNWGEINEDYLGPAFIRKFEAGDILYGSRRTYLRKVAVAHFDGITANTTFVIKANEERVVRELLPFVMLSGGFTQHSILHSKGSVNPYINWKDIADYEFLLPPKDQQKQIAELLWAGDDAINQINNLVRNINLFLVVKRESLIVNSAVTWSKLEDIVKQKISYGIVQAGPHVEGGMPYIKSSDLTENGIQPLSLQCTSSLIARKYKRSEVNPGDIIFSLRGNLGKMNIVPEELKVANLTQGTARISVNSEYNNEYVKTALETVSVQRRIHAVSKGSTFKEISLEALRSIEIPMPESKTEQEEISKKIKTIVHSRKLAEVKLANLVALQKSLICQFF